METIPLFSTVQLLIPFRQPYIWSKVYLVKWAFSLCAYWLALLSKKLHFCIFRLWKKSGAIFASFDGLCGCQDDRNPRVHLLFPCERGRSMTLSYPQGAWNILASQAGVVGVLLLQYSAVQCSTSRIIGVFNPSVCHKMRTVCTVPSHRGHLYRASPLLKWL